MKIYRIIRTAIYWALTALVIVFVSTLAEIEILRYFIGGLMVFYGVEELLFDAIRHEKHFNLHSLYWNIIEIVIGLTLIVFVETGDVEVTYAVVCVGWAIWSILREARELYELTVECKEHKLTVCRAVAIVNMLESLVVIVMSLTMIIEPGEHHAKVHLYLLAVELFTKVLFPIIHHLAEHRAEKKEHAATEHAAVEAEAATETEHAAEFAASEEKGAQ